MKQEVIDFYKIHKIPIEKMVQVGTERRRLSAPNIRQAAENLYNEILDGLELKPIQLAWEVYKRAAHIGAVSEEDKARDYESIISKMAAEIAYYKMPFYKKWFRSKEQCLELLLNQKK